MVYSMNKNILLTIGILFASWSFAAAPTFCSSPTMAYQSGCTSTCAAIAAAGSFTMSSNSYGTCIGKATQRPVTIYKLELGKLAANDMSRCTIWEGDDLVMELAGSTGGTSSKYPVTLNKCSVGTTYDTYYITLSPYTSIAAEAVFPNDSSKKVRTTALHAANGPSTNWIDLSGDGGFGNVDRHYTSWGSTVAYKKLADALSATDLSSEVNVLMEWDSIKTEGLYRTSTSERNGFKCASGDVNDCHENDRSDRYTVIVEMPTNLTLKAGDDTLDLEYILYNTDRGATNEHIGARFLWHWDGTTLKYAGVNPSDVGGELIWSNVRSNEGL